MKKTSWKRIAFTCKELRVHLKKAKKRLNKTIKSSRKVVLANQTPAELAMREILKSIKLQCRAQRMFNYDSGNLRLYGFHRVDFYSKKYNLVIEVDGGYHLTKEQQYKDLDREGTLFLKGVKKILRFTNEEVLNNPQYCSDKILNYINQEGLNLVHPLEPDF